MRTYSNIEECVYAYRQYCANGSPVIAEGKCGNVRFEGHTFYSYAEPVAKWYPEQGILLTAAVKFSVTTSKHLYKLRFEFSPYCLTVPNIHVPQAKENLEQAVGSVKLRLALATSALSKVSANANYKNYKLYADQAQRFCRMFNLKPLDLSPRALLTDKQMAKFVAARLAGRLTD